MKTIWKYFVPLVLILIGVEALLARPGEQSIRNIPFVLGDYQTPVAIGLFLVAGALAAAIWKNGK